MKVSFAVLVFLHLFVSTSMASSAHGWEKSRGDDIGANWTETHQQLYSTTGSRRVLAQAFSDCYRKFFVGGNPPTGLEPHAFANIKYICQQIEEIAAKTLYVTMFNEDNGIAVYAGYKLPKGAAKLLGTFPRIQKWTTDGDIQRQGSNKGYENNGMDIQKGHLVPASTYSFDCLSMVSTFSYTNAVPQYRKFNIGPWKWYEDRVREFAKNTCNGELYLLTGTSEAVVQIQHFAFKEILRFFPQDKQTNGFNIAIPNSMWTAGCCIISGGGALGGFAAIGNNVKENPEINQVTVEELESILKIGIGSLGTPIKLFPGNSNCSDPSNQYRYDKAKGQWTSV